MSLEHVRELALTDAPVTERRRWPFSLSLRLAWRNLTQDRIRFGATVAGVSFSVILMAIQISLLLGFASTASSLVDRADADFWVAAVGARDVDQSGEIAARLRYLALDVPGVAAAQELVVRFIPWKRPDGGTELVIVVGADLTDPLLRPWNLVSGSIDDLHRPNGVIIDTLYAEKLGVHGIGDTVEINGHRARVVGFTRGVRTFTQAPYVFTSLENAKIFSDIARDNAVYLLVKARPEADQKFVRDGLAARLPNLEVWSTAAFSWQTRWYWLSSTGAGAALILAAVLGLIVGTITVAQTLYATTMERISEYAALRAIGAPARYLYSVILKQALLSAAVGYAVGMACAMIVVRAADNSNLSLMLPPWLAAGVGGLTAIMCAGAAMISIRRAVKADPAMVFN